MHDPEWFILRLLVWVGYPLIVGAVAYLIYSHV